MFNRRHLITAAALAAVAFAPLAQAQRAIDKPARIVAGFPPGGAADAVARLLADPLHDSDAPTVIVDNKAGASRRLGAQAVKAGDAYGRQCLLAPATDAGR
jgi:tripartite-type tricarboxylate transporter receptor subunit TctC